MSLTVSNAGSAPLILVRIKPFLRANQHARASAVQLFDGSGAELRRIETQLRFTHLIASPAAGDYTVVAGAKDEHEVWSEASSADVTTANFSAGSDECSIGSATTDARLLDAPSLIFPDIALGSGIMHVTRTLVSDGFADETRVNRLSKSRIGLQVHFDLLDDETVAMIRSFVTALGGAVRPFIFEYYDGMAREKRRVVARFRDDEIGDSMFHDDGYEMSFTLIELAGASVAGDI